MTGSIARTAALSLIPWVLLLAGSPLPASGQTGDSDAASQAQFQAQVQPSLEVRPAPGPITIDGELDDRGWQGAARATGFSETFPAERAEPPVDSEVWITYDQEHLYLAFIARDAPGTIRSSIVDRDRMWQDDYFGILLDTYGDAAWAYFLFANPLGVQGDSRFSTASGEDDGFDIVYRSEGRITDEGYQVEMQVPFKSLRFPDRPVQTWRVTFWRTRPRESRATYSWAAMSRDEPCFLCQFGTLTGFEGVEAGGGLELFPTVVASQAAGLHDPTDPGSGLDNESVDAEAGLGLRYAFSNGLTAEAAFNPDFSQVESDVGQIDVNETFALFFPERRPFFQEGSDLFDTFIDAVYTRQINDPDAAVKLIGRLGRTSLAYLGARDEHTPLLLPFEERSFVGQAGHSVSNILRYRQTYGGDESYLGALLTDRRFEDGRGAGTLAGFDGVQRFLGNYRLEYQLVGSRTVEPDDPSLTEGVNGLTFDRGAHTAAFDGETFSGWGQYTSLERSARHWNFDIDYWASSPTFRADNGFETRNDFRQLIGFTELNLYPEIDWLDRFTADVRAARIWNFDGVRKDDFIQPTLEFTLKRQTFMEFGHLWGRERFADIDFGGIRRWFLFLESNFSEPVKAGFFVEQGRRISRNSDPPQLGTGTDVEVFGTIRPFQRLTIEPSLVYANLRTVEGDDEIFDGYILRTRTTFNFSRELFLRLVLQYDDFDDRFDVEPLLTYKINPFTQFYIGSSQVFRSFEEPLDDRGDRRDDFVQTGRQFFAKLQYLFRL